MTDPSPVQPDGEITLTVDGHIAVIHISRPNKLNSFTIPMVEQLESHLAVIDDSEDVRAVIVTSAGRSIPAFTRIDGLTASTYALRSGGAT